jgi:hypothetical protein
MKRCRFCNQEKAALAKAHVIPRSFFKRVRGTAKYSVEMRVSEKDIKEKYQQAGHSDCNILCEDCERKFSPYDTHGHSVFTKVFEEPKIYRDNHGHELAYLLSEVDYALLKLFVLSLLWRASVSGLYFYRNVDLGQSHEDRIKSLIASGSIEDADIYQFVCSHQKNAPYEKSIVPPEPQQIDGINFIHLYLPDIEIVVKVDKRPMPDSLRKLVITPKPPHYLFLYPFKRNNVASYIDEMRATIRHFRAT